VSLPFASSHPELLDGLIIPSPTTTLKYTNEANMEKLDIPTMITYGIEDISAASDYEERSSINFFNKDELNSLNEKC